MARNNSRRDSTGLLAIAGLGAAFLFLKGTGGGGGGRWGIGSGDSMMGETQPQEQQDPTESQNTAGDTSGAGQTASEAGVDTSIRRLAPSEDDAAYVRQQQERAASDPSTTQGQITGAEPGTVDAGVTASAGGGRGPRFDSESGGEVVLSEPSNSRDDSEDEPAITLSDDLTRSESEEHAGDYAGGHVV